MKLFRGGSSFVFKAFCHSIQHLCQRERLRFSFCEKKKKKKSVNLQNIETATPVFPSYRFSSILQIVYFIKEAHLLKIKSCKHQNAAIFRLRNQCFNHYIHVFRQKKRLLNCPFSLLFATLHIFLHQLVDEQRLSWLFMSVPLAQIVWQFCCDLWHVLPQNCSSLDVSSFQDYSL